MAQAALVSNSLDGDLVRAGQALVADLKKARFPFEAAFWMLDSEDLAWKLVIVSSAVSSSGRLKAYERVLRHAPQRSRVYWPSTIRLEDPSEPVVRAVLKSVRTLDKDARYGEVAVNLPASVFAPTRLFVYDI